MSGIDPNRPVSIGDPDVTRPPSEPDVVFRNIGPYRLLQKIGEGGMGEVWLAEQTQPLRRQVALKVIKAGMDTAQVVARFEAERQALALMDHPNIAKVFDGGSTAEGRPYFVMEFVRGEAITDYCDRVKMPLRDRLELFASLCDGVQHAHQKGIIHRDLKPSNILVFEAGDRTIPRVIDFGIAKATATRLTDLPFHTEIGSFIGTPEYMSPEQAAMTLDVDTRSDVYSLGMICYQLLTGTLPFDSAALRSQGADEMRRVIREKDPPRPSTRLREAISVQPNLAANRALPPSKLASALSGELDWITLKAIEKDRARRYDSASAYAADIRRYLRHEPVDAGKPSALYKLRKFVRRHRFGVAVTSVFAALLSVFAVVSVLQTRRTAAERDRANQEAESARRVTQFLIDLFNVSDPSEARGRAVTAREVLDKGARQLDNTLMDQPRLRARLQTTIGTVYTNLGLYTDAEGVLEPAVRTSQATLGPRDLDSAAALNALATLAWYRNEFSKAGELYERVVDARRSQLGADNPDTLRAQFDLASAYMAAKRWQESEVLQSQTLSRQRVVLGDTHPDTLSSLNNLQYAYFQQKRYADAFPIAEEVLHRRAEVSGKDHPNTIGAMHNVATIYEALGDLDKAEQVELSALTSNRRVLGDRHPSTLTTWEAYARILEKKGRKREALVELQAILETVGDQVDRPYPQIRERIQKRRMALSDAAGDASGRKR